MDAVCPQCGKPVAPKAKFCLHCGKPGIHVEVPPDRPPQPTYIESKVLEAKQTVRNAPAEIVQTVREAPAEIVETVRQHPWWSLGWLVDWILDWFT